MDARSLESEPRSLVDRVMADVAGRIAARELAPGARLPSIRRLAAALAVSPSTIVEAYDRLVAEGAVVARRGSGFYVAPQLRPLSLAALGPRLDRAIDPLWIMRQSLDASEDLLKPGCGWLPDDWMPIAAIRRATRALARASSATLAEYGPPLGFAPLRQQITRRLAERGIATAPDQILLTDSGSQAIDLVCRYLIEPGDAVLVDDPCYFNFQAVLRAHRAVAVGVPRTPEGPDLEAFDRAAGEHRPRLYLTNAALHNPTGTCLAPAVAHRLLKLAEAHDIVVVEDDIFADFEPDRSVRLAALDGLDRVVRVGSFSKTLSASVRCGYVAARADWIEALVDLQVATGFGGPSPVAAEVVARLLAEGGYRRHVEGLRRRLDGARRDAARQLGDLGMEPWTMPRGGFYLWCRLPDGRDGATVARAALGEGVVLAPGDVFAVSGSAAAFMRFNVAWARDARALDVLRRVLDGPAEEGAAPDG